MTLNSAFTETYIENPFGHYHFDLRQTGLLRLSQPVVEFDVADTCCLHITTMKALNFQDHIPSIPIENLKKH